MKSVKIDEIYTSFGKIVNKDTNIAIYSPNYNDVIFYACNESENRENVSKMDIGHGFGTFCITAINPIHTKRSIKEDGCDAMETVCSLSDVLISVNFYSNDDISLDILNNLKALFEFNSILDLFRESGIAIKSMGGVRRLDQIVSERFEYRSQFNMTVECVTNSISMSVETWDKLEATATAHTCDKVLNFDADRLGDCEDRKK